MIKSDLIQGFKYLYYETTSKEFKSVQNINFLGYNFDKEKFSRRIIFRSKTEILCIYANKEDEKAIKTEIQ